MQYQAERDLMAINGSNAYICFVNRLHLNRFETSRSIDAGMVFEITPGPLITPPSISTTSVPGTTRGRGKK
jgi:hypothetical protein